jgi:hypothetical protein
MTSIPGILKTRKFQVISAAVVAAGAVAAVVPAVGASASPTTAAARAASAAAPAHCATSALEVWLGTPGDGSAGHVAYELEMSNISKSSCTLYGYPGVSAYGPGIVQYGQPAGRSAADPEKTVTLAPGATAHVLLTIADVSVYPPSTCGAKNAVGLKVYPPNDTTAQDVPLNLAACSNKKGPVYMTVRPTVAGAGIPGYSF